MKHMKKNGFTLIEMMIVMVIISFLVLLIIPNAQEVVNSAKKMTCGAVKESAAAYEFSNNTFGVENKYSSDAYSKACKEE